MVLDYSAILTEAHTAAKQAQAGMQEGQGLDCGFAWVTISGNDPLARYCRKQLKIEESNALGGHLSYETRSHFGSKAERGWQWWKPGSYPGQSIGIHEAGARAFNTVLAKYGIRGDVGSRFD